MRTIILLIFILIIAPDASAQKMMKIDSALKANSEAIPLKMKGGITIGAIMKYQFGPYQVISTKAGWGKSKSNTSKKTGTTESNQKASFILTANEKDTVSTNLSINSKTITSWQRGFSIQGRTLAIEDHATLKENTRNVLAVISANNDTIEWQLQYITQLKPDSSLLSKKYCVLTDGINIIDIKDLTEWEDGTKRSWSLANGFEFYSDGKAIAAVQSPMDTFQKKIVWMKNDLDEKLKNILAAVVVVLISYEFL